MKKQTEKYFLIYSTQQANIDCEFFQEWYKGGEIKIWKANVVSVPFGVKVIEGPYKNMRIDHGNYFDRYNQAYSRAKKEIKNFTYDLMCLRKKFNDNLKNLDKQIQNARINQDLMPKVLNK